MAIPRLLHQIWIQGEDGLPDEYKVLTGVIQSANPTWKYTLWDDHQIAGLLARLAAVFPELAFIPVMYRQPPRNSLGVNIMAVKSDIARYSILFMLGGCYMDVDVQCSLRLDSVLQAAQHPCGMILAPSQLLPFSRKVADQWMMSSPGKDTPLYETLLSFGSVTDSCLFYTKFQEAVRRNTPRAHIWRVPRKFVSVYHCGAPHPCTVPIKVGASPNDLVRIAFGSYCEYQHWVMVGTIGLAIGCLVLFVLGCRACKLTKK